MYNVTLEATPNGDYPRGSHEATIKVPRFEVTAGSLEEAQMMCRAFIESHELGSGNWAGGQVFDVDGVLVGNVSHNGRFWPVAG